jgi:hypothetical protein
MKLFEKGTQHYRVWQECSYPFLGESHEPLCIAAKEGLYNVVAVFINGIDLDIWLIMVRLHPELQKPEML